MMKYTQAETIDKIANKTKKSQKDIVIKPLLKTVNANHYRLKAIDYLVFFNKIRRFLCKN